MKKIHFIVLFIVTFPVIAQVRIESTNQEILNPAFRFQQLDTSEITTGNLINRSFLFTDHTKFYSTNIDTNTYGGWKQLYLEIFNAQLTSPIFFVN